MKNLEKVKTASSVGNGAGGWLPRSWGDFCNANADETNSIFFWFYNKDQNLIQGKKKSIDFVYL